MAYVSNRTTCEPHSSRRERSFLEAGLFGWGVIHAVAGAVFVAGWLFTSALTGSWAVDAALLMATYAWAMAGAFWWLSRRAQRWARALLG